MSSDLAESQSTKMKSKFITLLAFVSLAQGSYVPTLTVDYGLASSEVADLNTIIVNQQTAEGASRVSFTAWFDLFFNPEDIIDNSQTGDKFQDVNGLLYDSAALVVGGSCPALKEARNASYTSLKNAAKTISAALFKLVRFGSYAKNADALKPYRAAAFENYEKSVDTFYNAISTCLATTDKEVEAVINDVRSASLLALNQFNNAIFNAMNVRAALTSFRCSNSSIVTTNKDLEAKALVGIQTDIEHKYSLLKALYLYAKLKKTGIMKELYANQLALTVSYRAYVEGNAVTFNTLVRNLKRIQLGFKDDGVLGFSLYDLDLRKVIADFDAGDREIILNSFTTLHPNSAAKIQATYETIHGLNVGGDVGSYNTIALIMTNKNITENIERIEKSRKTAPASIANYTHIFFNMIRDSLIFDDATNARLTSLENQTAAGAQFSSSKFDDVLEIVANAAYTGKVSESTFTALDEIFDQKLPGLNNFCQGISAGSLIALLVKHSS